MISNKCKFIFIHVPKTGGTSVEWALKKHNHVYDYSYKGHDVPNAQFPLRESNLAHTIHMNPSYHLGLFVRNPWDRFVSTFRHSNRIRTRDNFPTIEFGDYLFKAQEYLNTGRSCSQFIWFDVFHLKYRQCEYMTEYGGSYLGSGLDLKKTPINFVGRFENLEQDYIAYCKSLDIFAWPLPNVDWDSGGSEDYRNYYDSASKKIIYKVYEEDINLFEYTYG
jgi:hypothetical protein